MHVQELVPEECLDPEGICEVDLSQDAYHYEIRSTGCLRRLTLPAIGAYGLAYQLDTVLDRVYRAEQHLTWGPDDLQLDWVPVTSPHPGRFDILLLHIKHNETWRCVLVKLDEQHYAHCSKSTTNRNGNRSYCMGYDKKSSLLGPGLPGSSAEGCVVCVLMVFKKCDKGCWHPPAQFKLRNEHGRPPQCDAECMQTLFGARSIHLKCRVCMTAVISPLIHVPVSPQHTCWLSGACILQEQGKQSRMSTLLLFLHKPACRRLYVTCKANVLPGL